MIRQIGIGDIFGEVFAIYGSRAGLLMPVAFWIFLAVAIVNGLAGDGIALLPVVIVVSTAAGSIYGGMVVALVRDVERSRVDTSVRDLVDSVRPVLAGLVLAGILYGVGIFLGAVALVVPGLILATIWFVVSPAIVIERLGVPAAFRRSQELVRGHGWQVFGVLVISGVVSALALLGLVGLGAAIADGPIVRVVFSALASTLTAPVAALATAVLYFRLLAIEHETASSRETRG